MPETSLPFDAIEVVDDDSSTRLTLDEFLAIPLRRRVKLLLDRRLTFLNGAAEVSSKIALAAIFAAKQNQGAGA